MAGGSPSFTADGEWMAFERSSDETARDLWIARTDGSEQPAVFLTTASDEGSPALMPDGKYVAYWSDESGRGEIYVTSFPSGEGKWQASVDGGIWPRWSPEGDRLTFVWENRLYEVRVSIDPTLLLSTPRVIAVGEEKQLRFDHGYGLARGGERVVAVQETDPETEDGEEQAAQRGIFVVQNWLAEFQ